MISEVDLLMEDIPRLEKKFGADNLFVQVLKAQLAALQNPMAQKRQKEPPHFDFKGFIGTLIFKKK
jgi:hypothetical protein